MGDAAAKTKGKKLLKHLKNNYYNIRESCKKHFTSSVACRSELPPKCLDLGEGGVRKEEEEDGQIQRRRE
jgi:hypothetical protein